MATKKKSTTSNAAIKATEINFEQKSEVYPEHVIIGIKESLKQAEEGQLTPYTGIRDMLR